jgi:hypothetical protein
MTYEGERLLFCSATMFDFSRTWVVVVSGSGPNSFGHMLLNTGGRGGKYFQVAGIYTTPLYMDEARYQRYLRESNKHEIRRFKVAIPDPAASQRKLEELLSQRWLWGVVVHNCEGLVEDIVVSGGGPKLHDSDTPLLPVYAYPH